MILPVSKSRSEALAKIAKLKKLKIKDYFLVATGPFKNAISMGVYSQKKLARKRIDEIIRMGFIPKMESVALPRKVYWVNWYKKAEKQPEKKMIRKILKQHSRITNIERNCK